MAKKTLKEQFIVGLTKMGFRRIETRSSKYVVMEGQFKNKAGEPVTRFMFVGSSGALRISASKNASTTIPVTQMFKNRVIENSKE